MQTKRVMILGVTGSLGGYLLDELHSKYTIVCPRPRNRNELVQGSTWLDAPLDVQDPMALGRLVREAAPEVIVNCVAVTPQVRFPTNHHLCKQVNGLFPHRLAKAAKSSGAYIIHISTDGVFSGRRGNYSESDLPDPEDIYGQTKLLGELKDKPCLTLRTTFFGVFRTGTGLVNWYLQQGSQPVDGYANYRFSPVSAQRLARMVQQLIDLRDRPYGVFHAGGQAMTKLQLLQCIQRVTGRRGLIRPVETPVCDRSLDSSRFWNMLGHSVPKIREMVEQIEPELRGVRPVRHCG